MRNSKLIALLSAGALVVSSLSSLAVSGNALAAGSSSARQRFSDGFFQDVITYKVENEQVEDDSWSGATYRKMGEAAPDADAGVTFDDDGNPVSVNDNYTGFLQAGFNKPVKTENNGVYDTKGYWRDNKIEENADDLADTNYNFVGDRSGFIHNTEVYAIWQKGFVGDRNVYSYLEDSYDVEERLSRPTTEDQLILLQSAEDDTAGSKAPAFKTNFVALTRDNKDFAPNALEKVVEGPIGNFNDHGIRLWGVEWTAAQGADPGPAADATYGITLELDAKVGHYTKWDGYIWAGTNGGDDDGEYLPVHIAYPAAIKAKNEDYGFTVLYGGEPSEFTVADIIAKDLPHDQWIWVIKGDEANNFVLENGQDSASTTGNGTVKVYATENATKGAKATLVLYNSRATDECYVWEKELTIASPNFYTEIYLRNDKNEDGNGTNYANGTFTTSSKKAEIRATATMLVNEGETDIAQDDVQWTWTPATDADKKLITDKKVTFKPSGVTDNIGTFEVANLDEVTSITYIVRAYSNDQVGIGAGQFDDANNATDERMYGSRTITIVFDKDAKEIVNGPKVGTTFVNAAGDAYYEVLSADTVKFVKYIGIDKTYSVPATIEYEGYTLNVVAVGKKAFASKTQLKDVTLPASVTAIENGVFKNCKNLTSVTFLGAITQPAKNVFLKAGKNGGKKLKVSLAAGTSDETIKALKKSNKNAKIK